MPFSRVLASAASSESHVIFALAAFLVSVSLLKRTASLFEGNLYTADLSLSFGYTTAHVNAAASTSVSLLAASALFSEVSTIAFGFLASAIVSWAVQSLGPSGKPLLSLNQIPIINAILHAVETGFLSAAILGNNPEYAELAVTLAGLRYLLALGSLVLAAVSTIQFLFSWIKTIGRDGRQQIPKVKKQ
ncbi:hypothetical protein HK100_005996 [Physocladia obscura]|uniref:Uncharacterized protein n=1 Tax=Physocladia obscura TaxID=109957 RepID=A0AAD5XBY3_9FUNG|nr:hypothetical protein HK100_005996 [Physocladia obscura]